MYGLAVIEGMTMSGHLSNIDEISKADVKSYGGHLLKTFE